jgi:hypothetical protein
MWVHTMVRRILDVSHGVNPENLSLPLVSKLAKLVDPLRNSALFPFERLYKHNIYSSRGVVALMKRYHG